MTRCIISVLENIAATKLKSKAWFEKMRMSSKNFNHVT